MHLARSAYRWITGAAERAQRSRFVIPVGDGSSPQPTVYFITPDHSEPAGGIRVIYRHVDLLNEAGMRAFVLHRRRGFRCRWFENDTKVTDLKSARVRRNDLLVFSELDVDLLASLPVGTRYAIFNQNSHLTWRRRVADVGFCYTVRPGLAGVITVSRHNERMLRDAFPGSPVRRVRLGIDPGLFRPKDGGGLRRIAYMPRRGQADARQLFGMLDGHPLLDGWDVVPLDGLSHRQVAACLQSTCIFLAFTYQEGFGLPAAEAMACGAYVVGNHGHGGAEFFRPEFSASIESGDMAAFRAALLRTLEAERASPGWCRVRGLAASAFIHGIYSPGNERADVAGLYASLLADAWEGAVRMAPFEAAFAAGQ